MERIRELFERLIMPSYSEIEGVSYYPIVFNSTEYVVDVRYHWTSSRFYASIYEFKSKRGIFKRLHKGERLFSVDLTGIQLENGTIINDISMGYDELLKSHLSEILDVLFKMFQESHRVLGK